MVLGLCDCANADALFLFRVASESLRAMQKHHVREISRPVAALQCTDEAFAEDTSAEVSSGLRTLFVMFIEHIDP